MTAIRAMDLTSLSGGESKEQIQELCRKALSPIDAGLQSQLVAAGHLTTGEVQVAAVCVFGDSVPVVRESFSFCTSTELTERAVPKIAAVSGSFPTGAASLEDKVAETRSLLRAGANEIDVVIDARAVKEGDWRALYHEVRTIADVCHTIPASSLLKVIIKAGEYCESGGDWEQTVYGCSLVCCCAGADFVKTSTGREAVNATLPIAVCMLLAVRDYEDMVVGGASRRVGFKAAGGIRTPDQAIEYCCLMRRLFPGQGMVGEAAGRLSPACFRLGASSLLDSILSRLRTLLLM